MALVDFAGKTTALSAHRCQWMSPWELAVIDMHPLTTHSTDKLVPALQSSTDEFEGDVDLLVVEVPEQLARLQIRGHVGGVEQTCGRAVHGLFSDGLSSSPKAKHGRSWHGLQRSVFGHILVGPKTGQRDG